MGPAGSFRSGSSSGAQNALPVPPGGALTCPGQQGSSSEPSQDTLQVPDETGLGLQEEGVGQSAAWADGKAWEGLPGESQGGAPGVQGRTAGTVRSGRAGLEKDAVEGERQTLPWSLPRTGLARSLPSPRREQSALHTHSLLPRPCCSRDARGRGGARLLWLRDRQRPSLQAGQREGAGREQTPPCPLDMHATRLCQCRSSPICHRVSSCWGPGIHRGCSTCRPIYLCRRQH